MGPYEIQVTVTDLGLGKMTFDRKLETALWDQVSNTIRHAANTYDYAATGDQRGQEMQYNETRLSPPTIDREETVRAAYVPGYGQVLEEMAPQPMTPRENALARDVPTIDERNREG